jgi:DNA polymerase
MGKLSSTAVGPRSDVYGFGRTMCYALFQTPQPLMRHWRALPPRLAELLESCLEEDPRGRPADFAAVLEVLDRIAGVAPKAAAVPQGPPGSVEDRRQGLAVLGQAVTSCTRCAAIAKARKNAVPGAGPLSADLFFVGESPGAEEDRSGKPFVGASGQLFDQILTELGIRREQTFVTNALKCKPPGRKPEQAELTNCGEHLRREVELVRPKVIVCLGGVAARAVLNTTASMASLRGKVHDYHGTPVICTYHPAYLLRDPTPHNRQAVLEDLRLARKQVK